jgi:phthiocerol/phenolphthiocerol synthesis type-I polyketide synthase B
VTASTPDEDDLRHWLIDYLVTTIGCNPEEVDPDSSLYDLGVGSRDAVVLTGELSELVGRPLSPVEFWQHSTVNALAAFLAAPESAAEPNAVNDRSDRGAVDEPIAVIGMGCRFPSGIAAPDELWDFLCESRSAVSEVPSDRWLPFDDGSPEAAAVLAETTRWGSFLDNIDAFDAEFFEISPREAARMDPQQRLLLEVAWEALENAGIPAVFLRRSRTGVFAGACVSEYGYLATTDLGQVDAWTNIGGAVSILANRLSYFFDFRGPSLAVDTACSSSLVAVHLACQNLRLGECDLALAAGVNLLLSPAIFRGFDEAQALSPTGQCHSFDAAADGFVRGEGCGVVVLKRLTDALRDGDRVLAVVRGSAVNQDGRSNGLMAPNPAAQVAVLRAAYANAGIAPSDVDYVEAHGTGTLLGDPIEARALGTVLGRGRPADSPVLVGAVKSNLGHLEAAAGIAGFIKTVLALQRGHIPSNLGFNTPNPHIPFDELRLKVVAESQEWPAVRRARRAGVSAFGFGGTNAHVVVEQGPPVSGSVGLSVGSGVSSLVVSGKSVARVGLWASVLADWLESPVGASVGLADVAHTLNHHRSRFARFGVVCARDREGAVAGLRALAEGRPGQGVVVPHEGSCGPGRVFVYSGQGSQWAGMGARLLAEEPLFAAAVDDLEPVFVEQVGFSLRGVLAGGEPVSGIERIQPVLVGLQLALTALWRGYGVEPDAVIGHSMGEVTAAVVAGALSVAEGLRVIATRSRLMSRLSGQGAMALVELDAEATQELIGRYPGVGLAVYASPRQSVIAGAPEQVDAVVAEVSAGNRLARRIEVDVASHHRIIDPVLGELRVALADLAPRSPVIPVFSTTAGDGSVPVFDGQYWAANLRQPVRFSQAIAAAAEQHATFIEISPHPLLTRSITDTLSETHHHSLGTLERDTDETLTFHTNFNATHTTHPPETEHPPEPHPCLPATPWQHNRFWLDTTGPVARTSGARRAELGGNRAPGTADGVPLEWFLAPTWAVRSMPAGTPGGSWLVLGNADLGAEVERTLGGNSSVTALDPSVLETAAELESALSGVDAVLYAPEPPSDPLDVSAGYRLFHSARRLVVELSGLRFPPKLFIATRNAQPVTEGDRANPAHAVLWGLGRTLALEHPEIWGGVVDLDESVPAAVAAQHVLAEAGADDGEGQVVYRAGIRHVARLEKRSPTAHSADVINAAGAQLVIGATGNIGPHLIRQLADMGAGTIVAVSRRPGSRLDELARELASGGTELVVAACDVTDDSTMTSLFDRFGTDLPPLDGVYLAAFAGGPATLCDMTDDDVKTMFRPKLDAAALVHRLTMKTPARQFVLFSSISGILGSRWLGHYAATTTFLDTFAYARRTMGLPAIVVNWGWWQSLADSQPADQRRIMSESGLEPMPDDVAIRALRSAMSTGAPVRSTVVAADWKGLADAYRARASLHIIDELLPTPDSTEQKSGSEFLEALEKCPPDRRRDMVTDHIGGLAAEVMGIPASESLDPSAGFFALGMDSLMSVSLQRALSASLAQPLPPSVIFDYPSVEALADYVAALLPGVVKEAEVTDAYDDLSESELLDQLSQRLN